MVRLDNLIGDDLFVGHRNSYFFKAADRPEPQLSTEDVVAKARTMFTTSKPAPEAEPEQKSEPVAQPEPPEVTSQLDKLDDQVDKLKDRFEQMEFTFAETGNMISDLREEMSGMSEQIAAFDLPQIVGVLTQVRDSQKAAMDAPQEPVTDPVIHALVDEMRALRSDVSQQNALAQRVEARLDALAQQVEKADAAPDPTTVLQDYLTTRLDAVNAVIARIAEDQERLTTALSEEAVRDALVALADGMTNRLNAVDVSMSRVAEDQERMAHILSEATLPEALVALRTDLATLAGREDPVLDLTAQREGFEQFNQSADAFLKRLECVAATMASDHVRHLQTTEAELSKRDADAQDLAEALRQLSQANTALAGLLNPVGQEPQEAADVDTAEGQSA